MSAVEITWRLLFSTLLAGAIGFERERHGRAAGLRTHILVGVGASLVMLTALYLMTSLGGATVDPTHLAGQVVSGIGFLGAGTIIRFRASVRGLTTAASLWAVAGIGLAAGAGFVVGAGIAAAIVLVVLFGLANVEHRMRKDWYKILTIETRVSSEDLAKIRQVLSEHSAEIRDVEIQRTDRPDTSVVEFHLKLLSEQDEEPIMRELVRLEGTRRAYWS